MLIKVLGFQVPNNKNLISAQLNSILRFQRSKYINESRRVLINGPIGTEGALLKLLQLSHQGIN